MQHAVLELIDILEWAKPPDKKDTRLVRVARSGGRIRLQTCDRYNADTRWCDRGHQCLFIHTGPMAAPRGTP